ncbi:proclotting enzyme-like [Argiope bruennichi]|uniref:CLIP domain-containing serine protease n=1 Tax=Argiope bruennichi TaxID=94029 RepID=A0A8T0F9T7_ARGBR|nr:proclotting enzyme-like [Argiope bruennichi]KAF8787997.1 Proclotting enzyme like protein [Argiope bruennichi]
MNTKYQVVQLLLFLILLWIVVCEGQIIFEKNSRHLLDGSCKTPERKKGTCTYWTKCISINKKIKSWDQLRPYVCGFVGFQPKICCPSSRQRYVSNSHRDTIPQMYNNFGTIATTTEDSLVLTTPIANFSGSPGNSSEKPSFLPDDCGWTLFTVNQVIGGQEAEKGSWPWMAVIFEVKKSGSKKSDCGGVLVTARHVVTAAHCVVKRNTITPIVPSRLLIRLGAHNLSIDNEPGATDVGVDAVRIHERYDPRIHTNDIAVLRLNQSVPFSNSTSPVCLPYNYLRNIDLSWKIATVTGFGLTSVNGSYSDVLMEVTFDIIDQETCRKSYAKDIRITDGHLCAGSLDGSADSCLGDSGGPLVTVGKGKRFYLVGIVSFGKKCVLSGFPGIYTRVTKYLDWLTPKLAD